MSYTPVGSMRPSRLLRTMRAGKLAYSHKLNVASPMVAEVAASCGPDALWLCMEHCSFTIEQIENCVRAAKMFDVDTIVRVPRGSYSDLVKPLEADAAAIMLPHVLTGKEAREIVRETKFHPVGRRALDSGNSDGQFCGIPLLEYLEQSNKERLVIVQIEDPEALTELDAIAEVPGIDMLLFGPGDFSQGLGVPGQMSDPRINHARELVAKVAHKHGKWAGSVSSVADAKRFADMGYNFLNVGADVIGMTEYFRKIAAALSGTTSTTGQSVYKA
jgi:4-hydroxy-2-oxoheptanedioate aldolase